MEKVFGIGWAKTGTTTLGRCFQILGYEHQSQRLDLVQDIRDDNFSRIFSVASAKQSFEDWPWIILFKEMDKKFPGSKFVLTIRDEQKWLRSYRNMLLSQKKASKEMNEIRRILYDLPFPNVTDEQLIIRYKKHNRDVIRYFSHRPNALLVVNWEKDNNWNKLCDFLGKDIPGDVFPHENKGIYHDAKGFGRLIFKFRSRLRKRIDKL